MAAGWGPPLMDFSIIGNLPQDYYQGQERARQDALRQQFQGGLPRTATGEVDWNAVMQTVAKTGNLGSIQNLSAMLPFANEVGTQQAINRFGKAMGGMVGAASPYGPAVAPFAGTGVVGSGTVPGAAPANPFGMTPGGVNPGFSAA